MSLLDLLTGGKSGDATDAEKQALAAIQGVQTPSVQALDLPALEQYAVSQNMTPAQTQAFLQQANAYNTENVDQTGTAAQKAALSQLANVANQGATGNATEQAQQSQIQQDMGRTLAGQRGAIDQQAQARGVAPGLLQAALSQQNAGQDLQNANQAALQAQSGNYQTALNAMAQGAGVGANLQGHRINRLTLWHRLRMPCSNLMLPINSKLLRRMQDISNRPINIIQEWLIRWDNKTPAYLISALNTTHKCLRL